MSKNFSNTIILRDSKVYRYLEGIGGNREHSLETATFTGNLGGAVVKVTGEDASKFPITEYYCNHSNGRPEYLRAVIRCKHKKNGEPTSSNNTMRNEIVARGNPDDQAGHILGNQFGGTMRYYNLFPQNKSLNMGFWRTVENSASPWLRPGPKDYNIEYQARLLYDNERTMRPSKLFYMMKFREGNQLANFDDLSAVIDSGDPIILDELPNDPSNIQYRVRGENVWCIEKIK